MFKSTAALAVVPKAPYKVSAMVPWGAWREHDLNPAMGTDGTLSSSRCITSWKSVARSSALLLIWEKISDFEMRDGSEHFAIERGGVCEAAICPARLASTPRSTRNRKINFRIAGGRPVPAVGGNVHTCLTVCRG